MHGGGVVSELHDLIRTELVLSDLGGVLCNAVRAVLDMHAPFRIYDECGHDHTRTETGFLPEGVVEIDVVGLVCETGVEYVICAHCCAADGDGQTEECVSGHDHDGFCHPCPTVRVIAEKLGLIAEVSS